MSLWTIGTTVTDEVETIQFVRHSDGNVSIIGKVPEFTSCTLDWVRSADNRVALAGNLISFLGVVYQIEGWDSQHCVLNLRLLGDYREFA